MKKIAISFCLIASVVTAGCAPTTTENVGSFELGGQTYVIKSTSPGNTTEASSRDLATYSVKVKGGTASCDGSTSDCREAAEQKIREGESDEGAYG